MGSNYFIQITTALSANLLLLLFVLAPTPAFGHRRHLLAAVTDTSSETSAITRAHNAVRALHSAAPLKWNTVMAKLARSYAAKCTYRHSTLQQRKNAGENLAAFYGYPLASTYNQSMNGWYRAELPKYNFKDPGASRFQEVGHLTQILWKSTKKLGCGRATCTKNSPFGSDKVPWVHVVCRYGPAGNIMSSSGDKWALFKRNVLPLKRKKLGARSNRDNFEFSSALDSPPLDSPPPPENALSMKL